MKYELNMELCAYLSDYINEEISRGAAIDKYTVSDAIDAFYSGASIESTNEQ